MLPKSSTQLVLGNLSDFDIYIIGERLENLTTESEMWNKDKSDSIRDTFGSLRTDSYIASYCKGTCTYNVC